MGSEMCIRDREKLAQQRQAAAEDKPVFMTKSERERLEAEQHREDEEMQELVDEAERAQRQEYMQKVRDALRDQRQQERSQRGYVAPRKQEEAPKSKEELDKEKELQEIKNAYLGVKKQKKKVNLMKNLQKVNVCVPCVTVLILFTPDGKILHQNYLWNIF